MLLRNNLVAVSVLALFASLAHAQSVPASATDDRPTLSYTGSKVTKPHLKKETSKEAAKDTAAKEVKYSAPHDGEITVSDRDFNRFVFPAGVTQLVFPAGAPLLGKPVYLSNNTQVLIQLQRGQDKPVQMVVETDGGQVYTLNLLPRPVDGIVQHVDGARDHVPAHSEVKADQASDAAPHGEDIELLKRVVQGDIPADFDSIKLPRPTRFDKFTVVPLAGWSDGTSRRVMVFSLVAVPGQTAVVAPPQFYRPGINAVLVDGDVVDANNSPNLYVVEETNDE